MDHVEFERWGSRMRKMCNTAGVGTCSCNEILVRFCALPDVVGLAYVAESNFWRCSGVKVKVNPACFRSTELVDSTSTSSVPVRNVAQESRKRTWAFLDIRNGLIYT